MKMKRLIAMLMALVTILSLCACSPKEVAEDPKPSESDNVQQQPEAPAEEELDPVELVWWVGMPETEDSDFIEAEVNKYLEGVLPNTTVDFVWVDTAEWGDRWSKAMAAQEQIDLSWFGWINKQETEIDMGSIMPIDDLLAQYGQGIVDTLSQQVIDLHRALDGNAYFLPAWQGLVGKRHAIYLPAENVDLLGDEWATEFQDNLYATWDKPYWDDSKDFLVETIEEYLAASKEAGKLGFGYNLANDPYAYALIPYTETLIEGIHVTVEGDTYYLEAQSSPTSQFAEALPVYRDWYEKGYIREDVASAEAKQTVYSAETTTNYITHAHNGWTDDAHIQMSNTAGMEIDGFYTGPYCWFSKGFSTGAVIPATAKNPERAMMFLNLIYTDAELYQLIVYGVEGTHYTKNDDGTITIPDGVSYVGPYNWMIGTCENSLPTSVEEIGYYDELKALEEGALVKHLDGFTFVTTDIDVEISNLNAVLAEYTLQTMCASDNWEQLLAERSDKIRAAGIETIMNEAYEQLLPYVEAKGMKLEIRGY